MVIEYGPGFDFETPDDGQIYHSHPALLVDFIKPGASYWHYYDGKEIVTLSSDAVHPLDNFNNKVRISGTNKIRISFSYPPSRYTVSYWHEKYIGDFSTYEDNFETMEIENAVIELPDLDHGYIFEIKAV
jgi:hypothetical protein